MFCVRELSHETQLYVSLGSYQNVGVSGPALMRPPMATCSVLESLQVVARTSSSCLK